MDVQERVWYYEYYAITWTMERGIEWIYYDVS